MMMSALWSAEDTTRIRALPQGADKVYRTKLLGVACMIGSASERSQHVGPTSDAFTNAADLRTYIENVVSPVFEARLETEWALQEFLAYKQGARQPIMEFFGIKWSLYEATAPDPNQRSFAVFKREVINSVFNFEVKSAIIRGGHDTYETLRDGCARAVAQEREILRQRGGGNFDGLAHQSVPMNLAGVPVTGGQAGAGQGEPMDWESMNALKNMKCYNCSKFGHLARDCRGAGRGQRGRGGGASQRGGHNRGQRGQDDQKPGGGNQRSEREKKSTCHRCGFLGHYSKNCKVDPKKFKKKPGNNEMQSPEESKPTAPEAPPTPAIEYVQNSGGTVGQLTSGGLYPALPQHDPAGCQCPGCLQHSRQLFQRGAQQGGSRGHHA
jgi:hypothetical protein